MPGRPHHTEKMHRCVEQVMAKGHTESSAYAICTTSFQNAGEEVFEAAEMKTLESSEPRTLHLLGAMGTVRRETLNDRSYLVVPIVALMEGVIHAVNASTPEFVPGEVLARAAASWIGKPVTLGHPAKDGRQCSASDASIRKASGIGVIMKSEYKDRRLLQEAWIDEEKAKILHPVMYEALSGGKTEEVSVGAHVVANQVGSSFNGKFYKGTWLEASGDHLAFLPGGRGACSCEMGCGTYRAAATHVVTEEEMLPFLVLGAAKECPMCHGSGNKDGNPCEVCEGYGEIRTAGGPGSGNFGHSGSGKRSETEIEKYRKAQRESVNSGKEITLNRTEQVRIVRNALNSGKYKDYPDEAKEAFAYPKMSSEPQEHWGHLDYRAWDDEEIRNEFGAWVSGFRMGPEDEGGPKQEWIDFDEKKSKKMRNAQHRIKSEGGKHVLYSKDGTRRLAEHLSRAAAEEHLAAIDRVLASK